MAYTTINKSSDYFNTVTYSGTGATQSITGVGFQPDWIWGKGRTLAGYNHGLVDSVRGTGINLYSNLTDAEGTYSTGVTSFDSDGFSVGSGNVFNNGSNTYVAWNWLGANGTASNTDGTITSTVSANTTSGFSIVSYTGTGANATVGHGLGVTPSMVIVKNRSEAYSWNCYHQSLGATKYILLDSVNASETGTTWNDTAPTSSVFSIGSTSGVNKNTNNLIAYCFADVTGYSKFGSWTGNGNADGTFVYLGFKPAFVILKNASGTNQWLMFDNTREPANVMGTYLEPNSALAEANFDGFDFLSNGLKMRTSDGGWNTSGNQYIYMAFAEAPLVGSNNVPCTAR